ncbi:hypothetical protein T484DRAFT_1784776 [Baffinella frigidus]|nr:hypothetical protein T484DRAFT_1784776 [Cryptophyta sp. CCMP2293]
MDRSYLTQDSNWLKLVKPHDGDNFKEQMFSEHCLNHFQMILVTKKPSIPAEFADQFFLITTA